MENYTYDTELTHHGIKGQRWGIRRYQNPDGTYTDAGKKRERAKDGSIGYRIDQYKKTRAKIKKVKDEAKIKAKKAAIDAKNKAKLDEAKEKAQAKIDKAKHKYDKEEEVKPKSLSEMSNEEVQAKIDRINLENRLKTLQPQEESKVKEFMEDAWKQVVKPAMINTGKAWMEKTMKEALGIDSKSKYDRLKEQKDILGLEKDIKELKDKAKGKKSEYEQLKEENDLLDMRNKIRENEKKLSGEKTETELLKEREDRLRSETNIKDYEKKLSGEKTAKELQKEADEEMQARKQRAVNQNMAEKMEDEIAARAAKKEAAEREAKEAKAEAEMKSEQEHWEAAKKAQAEAKEAAEKAEKELREESARKVEKERQAGEDFIKNVIINATINDDATPLTFQWIDGELVINEER